MKKPQKAPEWATAAGAKIYEPFESVKKQGWKYQDVPSLQTVNWWMNTAYQWQQYFEATTDGLNQVSDKNNSQLSSNDSELEELQKQMAEAEKRFREKLAELSASVLKSYDSHPSNVVNALRLVVGENIPVRAESNSLTILKNLAKEKIKALVRLIPKKITLKMPAKEPAFLFDSKKHSNGFLCNLIRGENS